jgi:dTDP-4-amino-4,6-dideoxygalactose transaminase
VANGTDALQLTLRALGIGPGDEVVVPTMTFVATAEAVVLAGATPCFADVDPDTLLLTEESVRETITSRTKAVIPVHLYGQMADMPALCQLARREGLVVIEDAAQAHGASWRGQKAGSLGNAGTFSFYPSKNLGAFGDAGAVVTSDAALAERVRSLANHGRPSGSHQRHTFVGTTSRLDSLQAMVLRAKLTRLGAWTAERRQIAAVYEAALADTPGVAIVGRHHLAEHVYHLFVIRVSDRDTVRAELERRGVQAGIHYSLPCHQQPAFAAYAKRPLPHGEAAAAEVLSLPLYPHMTRSQIERVLEATESVLTERAYHGASAL